MKEHDAELLLIKYRERSCSDEEIALLESWYAKSDFQEAGPLSARDWDSIANSTAPSIRTSFKKLQWVAVAASILLFLSAGYWLNDYIGRKDLRLASQNVMPKGNAAILTLSNGRKIVLNDSLSGEISNREGISISRTNKGEIIYTVLNSKLPSGNNLNTISTPKGGQWQVRLPDGSVVFLNAESSLTYPESFGPMQKRVVNLTGEAYFKIAKDKKHPFLVKSANQVVEVLGTQFNINSYKDEPEVKTTLLEGSIKLTPSNDASIVLQPGQQAIVGAGQLKVKSVSIDEETAWKDGYFVFNDEPIEGVMKKLARWYDIEVEYEAGYSRENFNGMLSRSKNLQQIIKLIEDANGAKFKIEGRKVIVIK